MTHYKHLGIQEHRLLAGLDAVVGESDLADLARRHPDADDLGFALQEQAQGFRQRINRDIAEELLVIGGEPVENFIRFLESIAVQLAIYADHTAGGRPGSAR